MNDPLISVIVPVYKAEPYLDKCINSIRNQTYKNLEIILVDDGSPDRCGEMCDAYAKTDSRIRVFHKENGGQSSARNLGLDNMTGEYVGFVDSDDWIEPDMYRRLYDQMVETESQISICGIQMDYLDGRVAYMNVCYPEDKEVRIYTMKEALREALDNTRITYSPCDKLYHKDIFLSLRMTEGKIYEDMEMIPKCVERAERVVYDPNPLYHYNLTNESTIRGEFKLGRFAEMDVALEKAKDYQIRYPELYDKAMARYIAICLSIVYMSAGVDSCRQRRKELISVLRNCLPQAAVKAMRKQDRIKLMVLRLSPALFTAMMGLFNRMKNVH